MDVNVVKDRIRSEIINFFNQEGIEYDSTKEQYDAMVIRFFETSSKFIFPKQRNVHYSRELQDKIGNNSIPAEIETIIESFKNKFQDGRDMNSHLTRKIFDSDFYDKLCNSWNIKHLHLNDNEGDMRQNRSGYYLLVLVTGTDVYFLDVCKHLADAEFADVEFLWIIHRNGWLQYVPMKLNEDTVRMNDVVREKRDIHRLWENHINPLCFEFDGRYYISGNGMTLNGNSISSTGQLINLNKRLNDLCRDNESELINVTVEMFKIAIVVKESSSDLVSYVLWKVK